MRQPATASTPLMMGLMALSVACGPEEIPPDGAWNVTVSSALSDDGARIDSTCIGDSDSVATYQASYTYELYYDVDSVSVDIDGQAFAQGTRTGCSLSYESAIWLEERPAGLVTWRIIGSADYRGGSGGCEERFESGIDWNGVEIIEVVDSEDETITPGCTYNLDVVGSWKNGG